MTMPTAPSSIPGTKPSRPWRVLIWAELSHQHFERGRLGGGGLDHALGVYRSCGSDSLSDVHAFPATHSATDQLYPAVPARMAGFARFVELMDVKPSITDAPDAVTLHKVRGEIELENVSFEYNSSQPVLKDVSLKIPRGLPWPLWVLQAGKTTLCQLIRGFMM